ncbi:MAG: DegV family protein [Oscillospiraceae bacterium]
MNQQKIAILTDSCADLRAEAIGDAPIFTVPLRIRVNERDYFDGVDITAEDIYRHQAAGEDLVTSLPESGAVVSAFQQIQAAGYEKAVALHLSSGLSGTFNMVRLHALGQKEIQVAAFDSLSGSVGIGSLALQVAEDLENGMDWETLTTERIPALIAGTHAYFSVDTLEFLLKGGRIGKVTAMAGTMLNIKPVISFAPDGQLQSVAKVRGTKQVQGKIIELMRAQIGDHKRYNLAVTNGGAFAAKEELKAKLAAEFPLYTHFWDSPLDATLSSYIGSGVIGASVQILD